MPVVLVLPTVFVVVCKHIYIYIIYIYCNRDVVVVGWADRYVVCAFTYSSNKHVMRYLRSLDTDSNWQCTRGKPGAEPQPTHGH
jgi:hypothetical protein